VNRPRLLDELLELRRLPGVAIEMSGDAGCRLLYDAFTRRHARWRLIQSHRWGVALLHVPDTFEAYLSGPERSHLRREYNRALRAGFTFERIDPLERIDEIMAIHRSADERQGEPIHPAYLDEGKVRAYLGRAAEVFGVVDGDGILRAYLCLRTCGQVACIERLLGHADVLRQGVMWVLVAGTVRAVVDRRGLAGQPTWLMYDMFPGAQPGLRRFKRWMGLEPYRVSWSWRDRPAGTTPDRLPERRDRPRDPVPE
jgi:hypothetical protein